MTKYKKKLKVNRLRFDKYCFGILIAVELLMSFTFLGYVHIPPISITMAYIPIIIAGCLFGPLESTIAGLVFGLGSMYKASAFYVMYNDMIFSPFHSGYPLESILLSVGTRTLFGLIVGVLFALARSIRYSRILNAIIAVAAPRIHAFFVFSAMGILFPETGYSASSALNFNVSDIAACVICVVCVEFIPLIYYGERLKNFRDAVNQSAKNLYSSGRIGFVLFIVGAFVVLMSVFSTVYFTQRASYMMNAHGLETSEIVLSDLLHLQVQFLISMLALNFILILMINIVYQYMSYKEYKGEMDHLTGVMGRRLFLRHCEMIQSECDTADMKKGWFLFIDVDHFKRINDTLGHTVGDETLKQVALTLKGSFDNFGAVGRVGGDEFAVIIDKEMGKEELERKLGKFLSDISEILSETTVSCSIGAQRFVFPKEMKYLLTAADNVLYEAKENGRACYVIEDIPAAVSAV